MEDNAELAADTLDLLKKVSTATITSQLLKTQGMRTRAIKGVRPVNPARCNFVGPAFTLRYVPLREDLAQGGRRALKENPMHAAIEAIPAGAVFVLDMGGDTSCGALGDVLTSRLIARGAAGAVSDGGMRDIGPLGEMSLPVFSVSHAAPPSTNDLLIADFQRPIACGGVLVIPGDIVVGDADGVVVIPRYLADAVAKGGIEQEEIESWIKRRVQLGAPIPGLYPPNEAATAEYRKWVAAGRPALR